MGGKPASNMFIFDIYGTFCLKEWKQTNHKLHTFMIMACLILYAILMFQMIGDSFHYDEDNPSFIFSIWWDTLLGPLQFGFPQSINGNDKEESLLELSIKRINSLIQETEASAVFPGGLNGVQKLDNAIITRFETVRGFEKRCGCLKDALNRYSPQYLRKKLSGPPPSKAPDLPASCQALVYAFLGDIEQASVCRVLSRSFDKAVHPGSPVYSKLVRQRHGQMTRKERTALWAQLVLRHPTYCKTRVPQVARSSTSPKAVIPSLHFKSCRVANIHVDTRPLHTMEMHYHYLLEQASNDPKLVDSVSKDVRRVLLWRRAGGAFLQHQASNERMIQHFVERITRIIAAFHISRPETAYCQGMSFVFVFMMCRLGLLLEASVEKDLEEGTMEIPSKDMMGRSPSLKHMEWRCLRTLQILHDAYGLKDLYADGINDLLGHLQEQMMLHLPELWDHLHSEGIAPRLFAIGWFESLFLYVAAIPLQTVGLIWDIWLADANFTIFIQLALTVLKISAPALILEDFEGCLTHLLKIPSTAKITSQDELLQACNNVVTPTHCCINTQKRDYSS